MARLQRALESLLPGAQKLLVAVSGGADSAALLRLLASPTQSWSYALEVAHLDHALRPESAEDAAFVRALCLELGLPFHTARVDVARIAESKGWNHEDAARRVRYSFLTRTAKRLGADAVLTAHTRDDQAETVLMQLLRGAAYLQGMPARRGRVVRPLLNVPRSALRAYLEGLGQTFLEDPTNVDLSRTRAWVRHVLLPALEARYPHVKGTLARHATLQQGQAEHFHSLAARLLAQSSGLGVPELLAQDAATQRAVIAEQLRRASVPVDAPHLEAVRQALSTRHPVRLSLPKGFTARIAYGRFDVLPPTPASGPAPLPKGLPEGLEPEKLAAFPNLSLRTRRPGDRVRLPGGSKKLSDLLIDRKVPREVRDALLVLAAGGEVLWVEGVFVDPRVARMDPPDADVRWMQLALEQARRAADMGELPIGAVVVRGGQVLGRGHNTTETDRDPTGHAELHALRQAAAALGDWRLGGCTLYVTLEPCPMCFGGALSAHLPRVVYGATNYREGALGGVQNLQLHPWKRGLEVRGGVLAAEARQLLKTFFEVRRDGDIGEGVTTSRK